MDYRYLKEWVSEDKKENKQRTIYEVRRGGDSLALFFKSEANYPGKIFIIRKITR